MKGDFVKFKERYNWGGWANCLQVENGVIDIVATTGV